MWVKRRGFTPHARLLLPSEPVSQYRCMNLPKTDDNISRHKMMQIPYLDIWSMLLSRQVPHRSNSSFLFWNLSRRPGASSNTVL